MFESDQPVFSFGVRFGTVLAVLRRNIGAPESKVNRMSSATWPAAASRSMAFETLA